MTDKPLSETHRTFASKANDFFNATEYVDAHGVKQDLGMYWHEDEIQKYTVDIAEYERLKKEADSWMEDARRNLQNAVHWKSEYERLKKELERWSKGHPHTDDCPDMECSECAKRDCPHQDGDHYHHDGCPSCWSREQELIAEGERRAMERVKEAMLRLDKQFSKGAFPPTFRTLYRELGLDKEVRE